MSWAGTRRAVIFTILGLVLATVVTLISFATFYEAPSCQDKKQNQNEAGVDCGGPCAYLCPMTSAAPTVTFARAVLSGGRTDVVAYVENSNQQAATRNAPYTVELYSDAHTLIASREGRVDLPAGASVPLFIPNIYSGNKSIADVFITFKNESLSWFVSTKVRPLFTVQDVKIIGDAQPKITAIVSNTSAESIPSATFIVTVFDAQEKAIAASQTVALDIGAQKQVPILFTWKEPFESTPARVDVRAVPVQDAL